jgi:hypothetical protein
MPAIAGNPAAGSQPFGANGMMVTRPDESGPGHFALDTKADEIATLVSGLMQPQKYGRPPAKKV